MCNTDYYMPCQTTGKCNRGLMVIGSLKYLVKDRDLTADEEKKAIILGWCVEWVSMPIQLKKGSGCGYLWLHLHDVLFYCIAHCFLLKGEKREGHPPILYLAPHEHSLIRPHVGNFNHQEMLPLPEATN